MSKKSIVLALVALCLAAAAPLLATATTDITYGNLTLNAPDQTTHWEDVWDLTQGPLTLSYTLDMTGLRQPPPPGDPAAGEYSWYYVNHTAWVEVGLRTVGGSDYSPGPTDLYQGYSGGWMISDADAYLGAWGEGGLIHDRPDTLDLDDNHNLQASGGRDHRDYDVLGANPTAVVPAFGTGDTYGFWFDRDGVDPYQSGLWGQVNGGTFNTGGIYDISITYRAVSDGLGTMIATINGVPQGIYTGGWNDAAPDLVPAGLSFKGDMRHLQVFAGLRAEPSFAYGSAELRDITVSGMLGSADTVTRQHERLFVPLTCTTGP